MTGPAQTATLCAATSLSSACYCGGTQEHKYMDSESSAAADCELPAWIRLAADTIAQSLGEAADCDMSHGCMIDFDRIETFM